MKVTIRDIARAVGVSPATVSNAFSGNNRISDETRMRVLETARKMGYRDMLNTATGRNIHFVIFRKHGRVVIDSPFFSELISGIERGCRTNGYELTISYVHHDEKERIEGLIRESGRPMILLATEMWPEDVKPFLKVKNPMVVLDSRFLDISFSMVHIDNIKAGYIAGEHLIRTGHREFGMITSAYPFNNVRDRRLGFEMAVRENGFTIAKENIFSLDPTVEGAYEDMRAILEARGERLPHGIFAFNDLVAAGAVRAMKNHGISVPGDVSVIGMDNMPAASMISPALTTVHVPKYDMGQLAVDQLLRQMRDGAAPMVRTVVDVNLVERDSVAQRET